MTDSKDNTSNLPKQCPNCNGAMEDGFVHGGEDIVCWSTVNRNEVIEGLHDEVRYLQRRDWPRSFRLSYVEDPEPLRAVRCAKCNLVTFAYVEALDLNEFKKNKK